MENTNAESNEQERGCLLTSVLSLSLLGALFNSFFSVAFLVVNFPKRLGEVEYWAFLIFAIISIYGIYAICRTFKMKKKYGYRLLGVMGLTSVFLVVGAFCPMPVTEEQKAGAGWMLIFAMICAIFAIIVACYLKKMK